MVGSTYKVLSHERAMCYRPASNPECGTKELINYLIMVVNELLVWTDGLESVCRSGSGLIPNRCGWHRFVLRIGDLFKGLDYNVMING